MAEKTDKLSLRQQMKKKKYTFVIKESKFFAGVKSKWKFPRGKHSKVRQMHRGRPALPNPGYGSPREVKGLHSSGLNYNVVSNLKDMEKLDNSKDGVVISANLGNKKRVELINKALENNFKIINLKDAQKTVKDIESKFEERKKLKKDNLSSKKKKSEEKKKKAEEKKKEEAEEKKSETKKETKQEVNETSVQESSKKGKEETVEPKTEEKAKVEIKQEKPVETTDLKKEDKIEVQETQSVSSENKEIKEEKKEN